jgi:hypothetical protein
LGNKKTTAVIILLLAALSDIGYQWNSRRNLRCLNMKGLIIKWIQER